MCLIVDVPPSLAMGTTPPTKSKSPLQQQLEQQQQQQQQQLQQHLQQQKLPQQQQPSQQQQKQDADDDFQDENTGKYFEHAQLLLHGNSLSV